MKVTYHNGDKIGSNGIIFLNYIESPSKNRKGELKCFCGNLFISNLYKVKTGHTRSCGCFHKARMTEIFTIKYNKGDYLGDNGLSFINNTDSDTKERKAIFKCSCGQEFKATISMVKSNGTVSCGCKTYENMSKSRIIHGFSGSNIYQVWSAMKRRCLVETDTFYKDYGGRGICVSDDWLNSFEKFHSDMGDPPSPEHTLDRIWNDGPYSKDNCRWSTKHEQAINRRSTIILEYQGKKMCLSEWGKVIGISGGLIKYRLNRGWPLEEVLSPVKKINQFG